MKISNQKLGIGVPLNFPMIPSAFFDSFITMEKPDFIYLRSSAGHIDDMRNNLVMEAIKTACTHIIMMDTDQVYDPKTITRLLGHRLPVVGCLVYRRYPPFDPLMLRGKINSYQTVTDWTPGELVEVDATGTGCILFEMEVFKKVPGPWFMHRKTPDIGSGGIVSEDIAFCSDLREAGIRIFIDTSVTAGHLTQMVVNEGTWKLFGKMKEAELRAREIEHGVLNIAPTPI